MGVWMSDSTQGFHDELRPYLTPQEIKILDEIAAWLEPPAPKGKLAKFVRVLKMPIRAAETAIEAAYELVPQSVRDAIGQAIFSMLCLFRDTSGFTVSPKSIYKKIGSKLSMAFPIDDDPKAFLMAQDMKKLDAAALECIAFNRRLAATEGAVAGVTGVAGLVADVPSLYGLIFRVIQEVGICYGFSGDSPLEKAFMLKILEIGHEAQVDVKRAGMVELNTIQVMIRKKLTWAELEKNVLVKALRELAKKLGVQLTKAKLAQLIAGIGAVVGLAVNRKLVDDVGTAAFYAYRLRFLTDLVEIRRHQKS